MKRYLSLLLVALMMFTVLFVSISCSQQESNQDSGKYTVTFDTQGGSTIAPVSVNPGNKVKQPADPTRSGFVFSGWYKDAAGKTVYKFTAAVTGDIIIYAKWISEDDLGKVTLNYNYSKSPEVKWVALGSKATLPSPTRNGYVFLGWYEDEACSDEKKYDTTQAVTKNIDLYAKWVSQSKYEHRDPILPTGTGKKIPTNWSTNPKGKTGLPDIIYNFSGDVTDVTNVTQALKDAVENTPQSFFDSTPTKVLFVFSDGWGVTSVDMSREYKGNLILDSLPYYTQSKTDCYDSYSHTGKNNSYKITSTTDSPAGGTQVLTGYKTRYGYISLDADANIVPNLSDVAKKKGWKVACVTNDNIADATPACSIIHDTNRYHSDVLYYKELMVNNWDLLMGWDWGMGTYFASGTWSERLLNAAKEGIKDANEREKTGSLPSDKTPIQFFKSLSTEDKAKVAPFLIYYTLWEMQDASRLNSWQRWTRGAEKTELAAFLNWLDSSTGLAAAIKKLDDEYGNPQQYINRFTSFGDLLNNSDKDFTKPVLGSWTTDGAKYEDASPNRGHLLHGTIAEAYPSWPEMVAYTIYQLDKEAGVNGGFFAMIENTCTDGWGHSSNDATKVQGQMNEVQCFDEGVAIAVKYVLEHPDTLLVVSADHETGGYTLMDGWKSNFTKIKSTTTSHSSQNVPLYAFGAGADRFSADAINTKYGSVTNAHVEDNGNIHEGWITGALMGELITGSAFGQPANYVGE